MDMKESNATDVTTTIPEVIAGIKSALILLMQQSRGYAVLWKTDCKVENYKKNQISSLLLQCIEF